MLPIICHLTDKDWKMYRPSNLYANFVGL